MTRSDLVRTARSHVVSTVRVGGHGDETVSMDAPRLYSRLRSAFPRIAIVCPAEALLVPDTGTWVRRHGLTVEVHSSSELALAISAGIATKRIVMHGDGPKWGPIRCAANAEVRQSVVNSDAQVPVLEYYGRPRRQVILDLDTDHFNDTLVAICQSHRLDLVGLYGRLDSSAAVAPHGYVGAVDAMFEQMARIRERRGIIPCSLSLAGPVGDSPRLVAAVIDAAIEAACARWHFPRPRLAFTPQAS